MVQCKCFCCGAKMGLPRPHSCQVECNLESILKVHRDFCTRCRNHMIVYWITGRVKKQAAP